MVKIEDEKDNNLINEEISYLKEKGIFFDNLFKNKEFLYSQINNLSKKNLAAALAKYDNPTGPVNIVRFYLLKCIKNDISITEELINEVEEKFNNKDLDYFKEYLSQESIESIKNYQSQSGKTDKAFQKWTPISILYTFLYNDEEDKLIESALNKISDEIIKNSQLTEYISSNIGFNGSDDFGKPYSGIYLFPKRLKDYKNAYQIGLRFGNLVEIKIIKGRDVKDKKNVSNNDTCKYDFKEILKKVENIKNDLISLNANIPNPPDKYWLFTPGKQSYLWDDCCNNNIIAIEWDKLGDLSVYKSKKEIVKKLKEFYQDSSETPNNNATTNWDFAKNVNQGDVIFVKDGLHNLIGRGIIKSDYKYDESRKENKSIRNVEWTHIGNYTVDFSKLNMKQFPIKTLTELKKTNYIEIEKIFQEQTTEQNTEEERQEIAENSENKEKPIQYWWLNANPKIFKEEQFYTLLNENGNKRRIYTNFTAAKKGDLIIGYESTPVKQIVALGEITNRDSEKLYFKKTENLLNPILYSDIQDIPELKDMEYLRSAQGSLFKITNEEYNCLIDLIRDANPINKVVKNAPYSKFDYLKDVYQSDFEYETLKSLLLNKKNIILQGCPGVGKSFSAKRFAYSIMQEIDDSRIKFIQFHQNYSYEDFIMGYKPCENGFTLEKGVFYEFCKKAENDEKHRPYFFIIDEINRGNLSKIFGELLLSIEADYRGKQPVTLAYSKESFTVPENLYIIGMMNTADRSLALIDYALRRRFSFYSMKPAFDSDGFKEYQSTLQNKKLDKLIEIIKSLNMAISEDESLGDGFCIGHSYFCNRKPETCSVEWLNCVIKYDILPTLEEYWFDDKERYMSWENKLIGVINANR